MPTVKQDPKVLKAYYVHYTTRDGCGSRLIFGHTKAEAKRAWLALGLSDCKFQRINFYKLASEIPAKWSSIWQR